MREERGRSLKQRQAHVAAVALNLVQSFLATVRGSLLMAFFLLSERKTKTSSLGTGKLYLALEEMSLVGLLKEMTQ